MSLRESFSAGADPNARPPSQELSEGQIKAQAWYQALRDDNVAGARQYWEENRAKLQINRITNGYAPLHIACRAGSAAVVEFLVNECKANMISADKLGRHPFHVACESGSVETVQVMLRHLASKPSWTIKIMRLPDDRGFTPLHLGVKFPDVFPLLMEHVEDVSQHSEFQATPKAPSVLHYAVMCGNEVGVDLLLQKHALVNALDKSDRSPLSLAAAEGFREITGLLVAADADMNVPDDTGMTELHWCYMLGHVGLGDWLVEQGSNPQATDAQGQSATGYREMAVRELEEDGTLEEELALGGPRSSHARYNEAPPVAPVHHVHIQHTGGAKVGTASPASIIGGLGMPPPRPPRAPAAEEAPEEEEPEPEQVLEEKEEEQEQEEKEEEQEEKEEQEQQEQQEQQQEREREREEKGAEGDVEDFDDGDEDEDEDEDEDDDEDPEAAAERRLQREERALLGYEDDEDGEDGEEPDLGDALSGRLPGETDDQAALRMVEADTEALADRLGASLDYVSDDEDRDEMEDLVQRALDHDFGDEDGEEAAVHVRQRRLHPTSLAALSNTIGAEAYAALEAGDPMPALQALPPQRAAGGMGGTGVGDDDFDAVMNGGASTEGMRVLQPRPWRG